MIDWDGIKSFLYFPLSIRHIVTRQFWIDMITSETTTPWGKTSEITGITILASPIRLAGTVFFWFIASVVSIVLLPFAFIANIKISYESEPSELGNMWAKHMDDLRAEKPVVKSNLFDPDGRKTTIFDRKPEECDNIGETMEHRRSMPF